MMLAMSASTDAFAPFQLHAPARLAVSTQLNAEGTKITMPALSSTMKEGKVVSWLKSEGDSIEAGEAIMVVESDKADMDVEAFEDGFLAKIIVGEGEMAPVGEAVALIAESEADIDSVIASFSGGAAPAPTAEVSAPPAAAVESELLRKHIVKKKRYPSSIALNLNFMTEIVSHFLPLIIHYSSAQLPLAPFPTANSAKSTCLPCPPP